MGGKAQPISLCRSRLAKQCSTRVEMESPGKHNRNKARLGSRIDRQCAPMKIGALLGLILVAGCSDPPPLPTLEEKWAKVQSLNVEDSTVDELVAKLGAPYRSDDGAKQRSRFWYPFEGVTSAKTTATAPMLIVILDDAGAINSYMRSEPVMMPGAAPGAELRIVPRDYRTKINGKWKNRELATGKVVE
jgi:hypothetical protein